MILQELLKLNDCEEIAKIWKEQNSPVQGYSEAELTAPMGKPVGAVRTYLSIVVPAYNEEAMIPQAAEALDIVLSSAGINYQILFVDDGSSDHTWNEIVTMAKTDARIMGIRFSRNFGKESAILAGLAKATGDVVAVMDCDLQHPPETLIEMYQKWKEGYQVIEGIKTTRGKESALHSKCARLFYHIMSKSTGYDMENTSDFKMLDRKAVDSILSMPERNMFFRAASSWVGYKTTSVEFEVQERVAGTSKWSPWSLFKYAFRNIAAFTTAPLQIVTISGCVCFLSYSWQNTPASIGGG